MYFYTLILEKYSKNSGTKSIYLFLIFFE